jgi:hypothetical protein
VSRPVSAHHMSSVDATYGPSEGLKPAANIEEKITLAKVPLERKCALPQKGFVKMDSYVIAPPEKFW